jgi:hypothetical protein
MSQLPQHLQPGNVLILNPPPATKPAEYYIASPDYLAQAEYPGTVIALIVEDGDVKYQLTDRKLLSIQSLKADDILRQASHIVGAFVVVASMVYVVGGKEHYFKVQAKRDAKPGEEISVRFNFYSSLFYQGHDLTSLRKTHRQTAVEDISDWLVKNGGQDYFHVVQALSTTKEKRELFNRSRSVYFERWNAMYPDRASEFIVRVEKP